MPLTIVISKSIQVEIEAAEFGHDDESFIQAIMDFDKDLTDQIIDAYGQGLEFDHLEAEWDVDAYIL